MGQDATATTGAQLELFVGLAVPAPLPSIRMRLPRLRRPATWGIPVQVAIDLTARAEIDPDEIEEPGDRFTHIVTSAADLPMPKTRAPSSIFALAAEHAADHVISEVMGTRKHRAAHAQEPEQPKQDQIHRRIIRSTADGITRHISMRYQETEEWAEKERARRARQKLPKPPKQTFRLRKEVA